MQTVPHRSPALGVIASASALMLLLASCGGRDAGPSTDEAGGGAVSPGITDTSITIGTTSPLTGNAAGVGTCAVDGATAYFEARNDEGGITFGDGKTRTVEFRAYDDKYDPQRALANFQQMQSDGVFGAAMSLGTPAPVRDQSALAVVKQKARRQVTAAGIAAQKGKEAALQKAASGRGKEEWS